MDLYYPSYYQQFRCIAGDCPDSCCHQWQVQVDDASAERYLRLSGPLGNALRTALKEEEGHWYMENIHDRCPMWRKDGLCRIQAELGEEALCKTCREFPRLTHDYGDFVERGLELSCPEAAKWILSAKPAPMITEIIAGGEEAGYDAEAMSVLKST